MNADRLLKSIEGKIVVGIDEVGRGCWAGPLVVGAVILDRDISGICDSKKLTKNTRKILAAKIKKNAVYCSTGWVPHNEVDQLGLTAATKLAIERAINNVKFYDYIIIDGHFNFLKNNPKAVTIIKADSLIPAVSAASIVAKVARDEYMHEHALLYPEYGFDVHVGYGTVFHKQSLLDNGLSPLHRRSYKPIKALVSF